MSIDFDGQRVLVHSEEARLEHYARALAQGGRTGKTRRDLIGLAQGLADDGLTDRALAAYDLVDRHWDTPTGLAIRRALTFPVVPQGRADIDRHYRRLADDLDALLDRADLPAMTNPMIEVNTTNFMTAYTGLNDRPIYERLAALTRQTCPAVGRNLAKRTGPTGRIKIGFASALFLRGHTITKVFGGLISGLDRAKFDVYLFNIGGDAPPEAEHVVNLPNFPPLAYEHMQNLIAEPGLDILVYPDINMEPVTYFLALSRLAPVQLMPWGQPTTSGSPNMDYLLVSAPLLGQGTAEMFTEELVDLGGACNLIYRRPELPALRLRATDFFIPSRGHIYLLPHNLFKLHPDFDQVVRGILENDRNGYILIPAGQRPQWSEALILRLRRAVPGDSFRRIRIVPRLDYPTFLAAVQAADVVIDSYPYGSCNTALETLAFGTPVLYCPSHLLPGRIVEAMYQEMGLDDCRADSLDDLVGLAVAVASDKARQRTIRRRILERHGVLYENQGVLKRYERLFRDLAGGNQ